MKKIILCLSVLLFCFNIYAKGKNKENLNLDYGCPQIESSNYYFIDLNEYQNNLINLHYSLQYEKHNLAHLLYNALLNYS